MRRPTEPEALVPPAVPVLRAAAGHLLPPADSDDHGHGNPGQGEPGHSHHPGEEPGSIDSLPAVQAILRCGAAAARDVRSTGRDEESGERWCVRVRLGPCGDGSTVDLLLELSPVVAKEPKRRVERWTIAKIDVGP